MEEHVEKAMAGHRKKVPEERIREATTRRRRVLEKFGFVPHSTLKLSRGALSKQMFQMQTESPKERGQDLRTARRKSTGLKAVANFVGTGKDRKALFLANV